MDFLFLSYWFLLPLLWYFLLKVSSISLFEISIPSILVWFIYLFNFIGYPILWFGLDPYRAKEITDQNIIFEMFMLSSLSITFLIIGFIIGRRLFGTLHIQKIFANKLVYPRNNQRVLFFCIFCLFTGCCFMLYQYINDLGIENLALLVALDIFSEGDLTALRTSSTNSFENYHWYELFMGKLLLFCTFFFFAMQLCQKNTLRRLITYLAILICSFSLVMTGQKGEITQIMIGSLLIYLILFKKGKISLKTLFVFSSIGIVTLLPIYYLLMESSDILEAFTGIISRVTTGQIQGIYLYLEYFPSYRDFLLGTTFPNPGSIFPFEPVTITQEIMAWYNPAEAQLGIVGSMPAIFWVEAYINFGVFSLPIVSFFIGLFLFWMNKLLLRLKPNPLVVSFFVWSIIFYKDLALAFFSDFFINVHLIIVILFFLIFYVISNKGKVYLSRI